MLGDTVLTFPEMCHGCGGCVAECPHNAITQMHFTDAQVLSQIHALLADKPRYLAALDAVADASGWGRQMPDGTGLGVAVTDSFGTLVAQVVEVDILQ